MKGIRGDIKQRRKTKQRARINIRGDSKDINSKGTNTDT